MEPNCPKCDFEYCYEQNELRNCPECGNEWEENATGEGQESVLDANGNVLVDGDSVVVIKDLKFKGGVVKKGTKVKKIKLIDIGGHNIDCKIEGIGPMHLKSEFVKKG